MQPDDGPRSWFLARNNMKLGPFLHGQLLEMAAVGMIQPGDMLLDCTFPQSLNISIDDFGSVFL